MEYAIEAAALFNPSMVAHPDQSGLAAGATRFVMSVRAVGEGHHSSVEFRTGTIDAEDTLTFDEPGHAHRRCRAAVATTYSRAVFQQQLGELGGNLSSVDFVLEALPSSFTRADLDLALAELRDQRLTRVQRLGPPTGSSGSPRATTPLSSPRTRPCTIG